MSNTIKPYEAYGDASDGDIVTIGTVVQTAMAGNSIFQNSPVDLAVFKTDIEQFSALIAEAQDGSKKVIAEKDKQRAVVVKKLRLLGRYVEVTCENDMAKFKSSGFVPVSTSRTRSEGLSQNIRSLDHGVISGQVVVRLKVVPQAVSYELRYAAETNGATAPAWTTKPVIGVRTPVTIDGLMPGTTYAFQVRSLGKSGYSDWSDSVTFICT
jgi:hypothetical protein